MAYRYQSEDGLCKSNNAEWIDNWNNTVAEHEQNKRQWIKYLQSQGVKACHPDDGWVNREKNTVFFCYPQFNNYPEVGDTIALGWHWEWRLVKVVEIIPCTYRPHEPRYAFEPIEQEKPKEEKKVNWFIRLLFGK